MPRTPRTRPYRKRERARQEEETRLRITEAAVELHGTQGPARTSISEIARLAGVSRMTVYNHFPTDADLFAACSAHWGQRHPFPDPAPWAAIPEPAARLARALDDLYRWYEEHRGMLGHVFRDLEVVPAMRPVMDRFWFAYVADVVATLAKGWKVERGARPAFDAMLRLVLRFRTWEGFSDAGLSVSAAAVWAARMVTGAVRAT